MYFTMREVKHDRAVQFAVLAAHLAGEKILAQDSPAPLTGSSMQAVFEAAVLHVSSKTGLDAVTTAAQLLNQDQENKVKVINVGLAEISRVLGGKDKAMAYFRQIDTPRANIRFESVGGIQNDVLSAKNKVAVLAMRAQVERYRDPSSESLHPAERELVDFLKSVRRTAEEAVDQNRIAASVGHDLVNEIEAAVIVDKRPANKSKLEALLLKSVEELFDEKRANVMAQYRKVSAPVDDNSGPSIH